MLLFLFFFSFLYSTSQLSCLYYRIRADEPLTSINTMRRNCSSYVSHCLKIIHKLESEGIDHVESIIEGRCAFSAEECQQTSTCISDNVEHQNGLTTRKYRCCSTEDYSNKAHSFLISPLICLFFFLLLL